jgi:hypothetical protein
LEKTMNSADILARLKENEAVSRARRCACSPGTGRHRAEDSLHQIDSATQFGAGFGRTTFLGARLSRQARRAPELADGLYIRPFLFFGVQNFFRSIAEAAKNARRQTVRP